MRFAPAFFLFSAFSAAICSAGTIPDSFNQDQSTCSYSYSAPYGTCDVIGNESLYDIQSASVSVNGSTGVTTVNLFGNFGGVSGNTLSSFNDSGLNMYAGDLFFYAPTNNAAVGSFLNNYSGSINSDLIYAVPLVNHNGLTAGDLYQVSTSSIETATQALSATVLGSPQTIASGSYYRNLMPVVFTSGSIVNTANPGTGVSVTSTGDGPGGPQYEISLSFIAPAGSIATSSNVGLLWSSADCGNDFIQGNTGVPEPSSFVLLLSGVALVGLSAFARQLAAKARS